MPVAFNVAFGMLAVRFDYPDILRRPTDEVLSRFEAGGTGLVLLWWSFAMTAVLFAPLVVLLSQAIVDADQTLLALATTMGALAAIVQVLGLIRWPFLVPYLARAASAPDATPARLDAVDRMTLHQDALGSLGDRSAAERALEVVVLGEPTQHDVDRALPIVDLGVGDVGAEMPRFEASLTKAGSGAWSRRITGHAASVHDLVDQGEGMLRALAETDRRDIGSLPGGYGSDVLDVDLAGDHLVPEVRDYRRDERQPILALVGDQHPEMLGRAVAHRRSRQPRVQLGAAPAEGRRRPLAFGCMVRMRFASSLGE
jgi:hypothetical protein